jgi:hypothetical protein
MTINAQNYAQLPWFRLRFMLPLKLLSFEFESLESFESELESESESEFMLRFMLFQSLFQFCLNEKRLGFSFTVIKMKNSMSYLVIIVVVIFQVLF